MIRYKFMKYSLLVLSMVLALILPACESEEETMQFPNPELTFKFNPLNIERDAAEVDVEVLSNLPWRVKCDADWVIMKTSNGFSDGKFTMIVSENLNIESRETIVTAWITKEYQKELRVVQLGKGKQILTSSNELKYKNKGGQDVIQVTSNIEWEVVSFPAWLKLVRNEDQLSVVVDPNLTDNVLQGSIVLREVGGTTEKIISVSQEAMGSIVALTIEREQNVKYEARELQVKFISNVVYTHRTSASWLSVKSATPATKGDTPTEQLIILSLEENHSPESRTGYLYISGPNPTVAADTLKVVQKGKSNIELQQTLYEVDPFTQNLEIKIVSDGSWEYAFESGQPAWITSVTPSSPTSGDQVLTVRMSENIEAADSRSAVINIVSGAESKSITITQQPTSSETDRLALIEFYNNANGVNWTTKWDITQPLTNVSAWPKVTFSNGRVAQIDFTVANRIDGEMTPLTKLTQLTILKLKNQKIRTLPSEISRLKKLNVLWVVESAASGSIPVSIAQCQVLKELNISNHPTSTPVGFNNSFTGDLDPLIQIPTIVTIKAYCNNLSGTLPVIPLSGGQPTTWLNLKEFMIYSNAFTGSIPAGYGTIIGKSGTTGLFWVNDNQLTGTIPQDIKSMPRYATDKNSRILQGNNLTE